ncbi:uncharacterized protein LOC119072296 [Bradysia coprophila]|uniref:uncharacterized protein LOC119072296 n=1 Tax=Bradysia coprophila TaxID=38358 RepID=UPI00187DAF9B|nr:uncharacterized protein LOC119072296 [Bradysia coprophila]
MGQDNRILAFDNKNILVEYDNNDLDISGTRNHNVRPAPTGSNKNSFTIKSSGTNSIQFVVEYVGSSVINGSDYQLGKIKFNTETSTNKVNVTLHEADDIIYSAEAFTPDKIIIQAESNGTTQRLELRGERVEAVHLNSYNIFVNSG